MAELEKTLESESAKSKRRLDEAEQREIELMQAEKVEISRLLSLASHVGGEGNSLLSPLDQAFLVLTVFLSLRRPMATSVCG